MKETLLIYRSKYDDYLNVDDYPISTLRFLRKYFSEDYKFYDQDLFNRIANFYNITFIYNDLLNEMFYIGFAEWEVDEDAYCPNLETISAYVNETNSCKISHDNFTEFRQKWLAIKEILPSFAIIYRDDHDWIHCKGFDTKEEMEFFIQNYKPTIIN